MLVSKQIQSLDCDEFLQLWFENTWSSVETFRLEGLFFHLNLKHRKDKKEMKRCWKLQCYSGNCETNVHLGSNFLMLVVLGADAFLQAYVNATWHFRKKENSQCIAFQLSSVLVFFCTAAKKCLWNARRVQTRVFNLKAERTFFYWTCSVLTSAKILTTNWRL